MKSLPVHLLALLVLTALSTILTTRAADWPVQKTAVYQLLKNRVDQIQLVDTHEHLPSEADYLKGSVDFLLTMLHYVQADLVSAGLPEAKICFLSRGLSLWAGVGHDGQEFCQLLH